MHGCRFEKGSDRNEEEKTGVKWTEDQVPNSLTHNSDFTKKM